VLIPAGQTSVTLTATPFFDVGVEGPEDVILTVDGASASGTIADEPPARVDVIDATAAELAAPTENNTLTFVVSRAPGAPTAYARPVAGAFAGAARHLFDYQLAGAALTGAGLDSFSVLIPAGQSSVTLKATPFFDVGVEGTEDAILTVEGTAAGGQITDEPTVQVTVTDPTAAELVDPDASNTLTFVISRGPGSSAAYARPVSGVFGGTARHLFDYQLTGPALTHANLDGFSVLIPAGQPSVTLTAAAFDDQAAEPAETVTLTVENTSATGTITDAPAAAPRAWTGAGNGNWSDPANWSGGVVPGPEENVIIDLPGGDFVITIDGDFSVVNLRSEERIQLTGGSLTLGGNTKLNGGLTLAGGSLGGAGDVALRGITNWTGGAWSGPGTTVVEAEAQLNVSTPGQDGVLQRSITNDGTLTWNQASLLLLEGARIFNGATGSFEIQSNLSITDDSPASPALINAGRLFKTGPIGALTLQGAELTTTGVLELRLGETAVDAVVSNAAGTLGGTLDVLLADGFTPTVGQDFNVLQFGTRTGTFATINGNGVTYDALYTSNGLTLRAASGNNPPVANAGSDQIVPRNSLAQLDGSGSADPEGGALTYEWTLMTRPAGSTATLSNPNIVNPTFTADRPGTYVAQLVVNDVLSITASDSVQITTANQLPLANAGPEQTGITPGSMVTLDGSGSSDPDGDPITYSWTFEFRPVGSAATLTGANTASPTFFADLPGGYRLRLVVSDSFGSSEDTVDVFTHLPPAGEQVSGPIAVLSYYNPAAIPSPNGQNAAGATSLSYYNPAPVPSPSGVIAGGSSSLSYYNPAPIPSPQGALAGVSSNVSYYNPAPVHGPGGFVAASVTSVSYFNPAGEPEPEQETASQTKANSDSVGIAGSSESRLASADSANHDNSAVTRRQVRW
jgi:hypothetical protein